MQSAREQQLPSETISLPPTEFISGELKKKKKKKRIIPGKFVWSSFSSTLATTSSTLGGERGRLSIRRTDVRQRVTLSAALALIHVGDAQCYGNRRNKKRNEPPPTMSINDESFTRPSIDSEGFEWRARPTRHPQIIDSNFYFFFSPLETFPPGISVFFNFGRWNSFKFFLLFSFPSRNWGRERGYLVVHFLSFFLSFYLRDKKRNRKYKSLSPNDYGRNVTKAYYKDLIF